LFYACCDEVKDISFIEALYRILTLAADQLRKLGTFCEKTAAAFFDAAAEEGEFYTAYFQQQVRLLLLFRNMSVPCKWRSPTRG
jgi:hypothetical protein